MKPIINLTILLITLIGLTSCASHHVAEEGLWQKRKYRSGWHWGGRAPKTVAPTAARVDRAAPVQGIAPKEAEAPGQEVLLGVAEEAPNIVASALPSKKAVVKTKVQERPLNVSFRGRNQLGVSQDRVVALPEDPEPEQRATFKHTMHIIAMVLALAALTVAVVSGIIAGLVIAAELFGILTFMLSFVFPYTGILIGCGIAAIVAFILSLFSLPDEMNSFLASMLAMASVLVSPVLAFLTAVVTIITAIAIYAIGDYL